MPRLTKIYTRKGDDGTTALGSRQRVPKESPRVASYGTVDELNSVIGIALAHGLAPRLAEALPVIQNELFHLGSDLCFTEEDKAKYQIPLIEARHVEHLEAIIDELNPIVGKLDNFILPGGPAPRADRLPSRGPGSGGPVPRRGGWGIRTGLPEPPLRPVIRHVALRKQRTGRGRAAVG